MKERPILFSAPMVRALLAGTKTQTRRIVKPQPTGSENAGLCWKGVAYGITSDRQPYLREFLKHSPYGVPGDRLWVREAFTHITGNGIRVHYRADGEPLDREGRPLPTEPGLRRWWPSIHMPRKASRITLEVTRVRVERLHEISDADAKAEGVEPYTPPHGHISPDQRVPGPGFDRARLGDQPYRLPFADLWDSINGKPRPMLNDDGEPVLDDDERPIMVAPHSWESNPWVWVVEFKRVAAQARAA